jgi:zinc transporter 5/7
MAASSYALPASAIHSHHGHVHSHMHAHSHSHSTSPSRPFTGNTSRPLQSQRPNGGLHMHSASESNITHGHEQDFTQLNNPLNAVDKHTDEKSPSMPSPLTGNGVAPVSGSFEGQRVDHHRPLSQIHSYEALSSVDITSHSHDHHDHDSHDHHDHGKRDHHSYNHNASSEPRSKFTTLALPMVQNYPLLHTIMIEKDSRRIFYFMW